MKIRIQINRMFKEIVKQYKKEYSIEQDNYKKRASEKKRAEKIKNNFLYRYFIWIISLLAVLIFIVSLVGRYLYQYNTNFLILNIVLSFVLFILLFAEKKRIDSEQTRNDELKKIRYKIWKKAVENIAKKHNYSCEEYSKYLLEYHNKGVWKSFFSVTISMAYTIMTTYYLKDFSVTNNESLIILSVVNIILNFLCNIILLSFSQDYYYDSIKNDFLLTTH